MSEFKFNSPSVKITEREIPVSTPETVSSTSFGIVGEFPMGPAFEPIRMSSMDNLNTVFGGYSAEKLGANLKYLAPFYADSFLQESNELYVTRVLGLSGYNAGKAWAITIKKGTAADIAAGGDTSATGENDGTKNNTIVAIIRSKGGYAGDTLTHYTTSLGMLSSYLNGAEMVSADPDDVELGINMDDTTDGTATPGSSVLRFSLDPTRADFITNVIGTKPTGGGLPIYLESVAVNMLQKLKSDNVTITAFDCVELAGETAAFTDQSYRTPETPFVVSEIRGSSVANLFRFHTISDGAAANTQIKISIDNINPVTKEFDVVIRDFRDTDDNVIVLERFTKCVMDTASQHFVGRKIGAALYAENDLTFSLKSNYVYLEMAEDFPTNAFPAGFEGYAFRKRTTVGGLELVEPPIFYKKSYSSTDKIAKTYLGVSERAYDAGNSRGLGIDSSLLQFQGVGAVTMTKGFHMDSKASANLFIKPATGEFKSATDIATGAYADKASRKFTLVPYGGFDGWDIYREERQYKATTAIKADLRSDYNAYIRGIKTFSNPEETDISMLATPGINWDMHVDLVREAVDMIENGRKDCLYIMDAPDLGSGDHTIQEIVDLFAQADIDSSYVTTYYPHIQMENKADRSLVYIPATGEAARTMALTDREKFLWFANAGVKRGVIPSAKKARVKLKEDHRDTLHKGGINPIAQFRDVGVDIFGQRTTLRDEDKALSRINVRKLMNYAKRFINVVSRNLQFEQNDDILVSEFMKKVNPELSRIQRERGLRRFEVQLSDKNTPETLDRRQLFFKIWLTPTSSMEELGVELIVTPTGNSFSE
jgi:hypothetical protein